VRIISNLCKCMQTFNDVEAFVKAWDEFEQSHCPYRNEKQVSKTHHYKVTSVSRGITSRRMTSRN